ncbi:peptidylprolyl isomerase [Sphingosinicella rhizophila]|uniref:peptidylprolyl isomerase n=1 Tax=Sphingosinicella rhizophila TaxID=3050082 RepID=A0ABU3Q9M8_9SPHN|nr:peptidylprolyl isomerase [Sphingosinicella sp. GR2756]MDT9600111.1 peptidylprolyl isomerase [Sphingosinicella sp. GR2756]
MRLPLASALALLALTQASCDSDARAACQSNQVALETEAGTIIVEVYPDKAPASAGDFLKYVDEGRYAGAGFYRVVRSDNDNGAPVIEAVQGGLLDPSGAPGVAHESTKMTGLRHVDGALSLARSAPGTGSAAAFFISIGDQPGLDHGATRNPDQQGFAVFGRVVRGMDVVRKIHSVPAAQLGGTDYVKGQILNQPVMIRKSRRIC